METGSRTKNQVAYILRGLTEILEKFLRILKNGFFQSNFLSRFRIYYSMKDETFGQAFI